uniref:Replication protein n=1 Tax=Cruciviridae sp. TaxID=1955495 RepID=A0A1S6LVN8_9VIRU|nr:replication protein [Cruciviridae sp.]AQU11781.1 replication protein [Cruciviridae sp.]AQU11783.1 replication protein [Cruciviridae sp.]AQU11785.1 replication protein [Cruciviridae sp.]AQU11787.1 replication protein [Cruciviridae sp.]
MPQTKAKNLENKYRHYEFVINNYDDLDLAILLELEDKPNFRYLVCGFEIAPSTGTPHMQCYVNFSTPVKWETFKNVVYPNHFDKCNGTPVQNMQYCKKGEQSKQEWNDFNVKGPNYGKKAFFIEFGECPIVGKSKTAELVVNAINEGKSIDDLDLLFPNYMIIHHNKVKEYIDRRDRGKKNDTSVFVFKYDRDIFDEIHLLIPEEDHSKIAFVTDLNELLIYPSPKIVVYCMDWLDPSQCTKHLLWAKGQPITYKSGFQIYTLRCTYFIIAYKFRDKDLLTYKQMGYKSIVKIDYSKNELDPYFVDPEENFNNEYYLIDSEKEFNNDPEYEFASQYFFSESKRERDIFDTAVPGGYH